MLVIHHLNNSRSQRILWLLEELELPYEIKKYERTAQGRAPPELLKINPLGKAPVITDGDVTVAESGAIVEYIISKYGNGKAIVPEAGYLDNLYYTHYAEGSLMPILVQKYIFDLIPKNTPFYIRPIVNMVFSQLDRQLVQPEIKKNLEYVESHLAKSSTGWFAGGQEPTAADYQMAFPLEAVVAISSVQVGPKIQEYVKMVHSRPAYKRALEKGGEYAYAKEA
ncbi:thioredoxin-like protein [Crucibulum laeve]|uniref:glutathione transferase n=1 Tax=Crucibulum laeve TaxID=68775 RepID=A0A5C3M893_9AGAR|nr:thioredoxin-like protein [Crucibulum laeve]